MDKDKLDTSECEIDKNVKFPIVENIDFHLNDTERMASKDVSNFVVVEASPTSVAENNCEKPMQFQAIDMISGIIECSREEIVSEIINGQDDIKSSQTENLELNNSCITSVVTDQSENVQQVLEIDSNFVEESCNINVSSDIQIPVESRTEESSGVIHDLDEVNILSNEKEENTYASNAIDKSQLPPDVVRVLKDMLNQKVESVSSDKTQPAKHKIIVAKVPTNALKQMIAFKDDGTQLNKIKNYSTQSNNCVTKLPPNLAETLKNIIVQKACSQVKSNITNDRQIVNKVPSDTSHVSNKSQTSYQEINIKFKNYPCTKTATDEKYQPALRCGIKFRTNKYPFEWVPEDIALELEKNYDFGEHILLSSKKCLLLSLPYSPGFEDERSVTSQIIAEESGPMSYFEFTENCTLEKEFNKLFHYFSCPNLSNTTPRETVMQYIVQTIRNLLATFPLQEALELTCNCSLCWFLYVRGKIIRTYYPGENLKYFHSPLASYRTLTIRNIVITDLNPKSDNEYFVQKDHYFLPIRFKRGGKKRDLTKSTALCGSFNPYINGNVRLRRSKEAEINIELSKCLSSQVSVSSINNDGFSSRSDVATSGSIKAVTSVKSTVANAATSKFVQTICRSSLNSSLQNKKSGMNSKSSAMFAKASDKVSYSKPIVVDSTSTDENLSSKTTFSLKSCGPAAHKSLEESKRTNIASTSDESQILSVKNQNLNSSVAPSMPLLSDLSEVKNDSDFVISKSRDHSNKLNDGLMAATRCPQISEHSQKQVPISYSSEMNVSKPSKQNKDAILSPNKINYYISLLKKNNSDVQIYDELEEEDCISNVPEAQSVSPMMTATDGDINCKSDCFIPSDSFSINIKNKIDRTYVKEKKKCLSSVTDTLSSDFNHKLDSPILSDSTSSKVKQTEISDILQSKESLGSNSSKTELPNSGIKRKLELPIISYSASSKHKKQTESSDFQESNQTETPDIQESTHTETSNIQESTLTETSDIQESTQTETSDIQESTQTKTSDIQESKRTETSDIQEPKQTETTNIQESKECFSSSSAITQLSSSGIKHQLESTVPYDSASSKLKKQSETSYVQESKKYCESSSSLTELPSSGIKRKLESSVPSDSTSCKLKRIETSHIQESKDCLKSFSLLEKSSNNGVKHKFDLSVSVNPTSDKIKKQGETSNIQVSKEHIKSVTPVKSLLDMGIKCQLDSSLSKNKNQTQAGTSHVRKITEQLKKSSGETSGSNLTSKPICSGINIVKLPSSSNLFGTLENLGISGAVNVVNLPSKSVSGVLKTLGVSNPAPKVNIVKIPKSLPPDSIQTLPTTNLKSSSLNVIRVNADAIVKKLPKLAPSFQIPRVQSAGTIKFVQVPNTNYANVVQFPQLIGPLQVQSSYSGPVNVQLPNIKILPYPVPLLSGTLQVSNVKKDTISVVQDSNANPSSQKAVETSNTSSTSNVPVSQNSKKISDSLQRRKQVFSVGTYSDGTAMIGGFRGFKT